MGYNFDMSFISSPRRGALRLVSPASVPRESAALESAVAAFYDRTITAAWRLATTLYAGDSRQASDAVVEAYRTVWFAGPGVRTQAALLQALVVGARTTQQDHDPVPA